jgi:hypothetical protein
MLVAITTIEGCSTDAPFNILRVVTYPLDATSGSSQSNATESAILADQHFLSSLKYAPLLASIATSESASSILRSLRNDLKRSCEVVGQDEAGGQPAGKSRRLG